ncbi:MAG: hypothetical protein MJ025_03365 [Victivallaceae bacterium]|nr:hypothetical protein [Victivallaceae bacterium]
MKPEDFVPMLCPACGDFFFELDEFEQAESDIPAPQCHSCGWIYDLNQFKKPYSVEGENELSLLEYKKWYARKKKENPDYDYWTDNYVATPHMCPVCGLYEFEDESTFDICPECGWEDDDLMEQEPDKWAGCANDLCLDDYRKRYRKLKSENPKYTFEKNGLP